MSTEDIWRRKTNDEVASAAERLDEYTDEGRRIILAELERRDMTADAAKVSPEIVEDNQGRFRCPHCNVLIGLRDDHQACVSCGEPFPEHLRTKLREWAGEDEELETERETPDLQEGEPTIPIEAERVSGKRRPPSRGSSRVSAVITRYRDGYRVASFLVGLGSAIKIVGAIVGGLIALFALLASNSPFGGGAVVGGMLVAAIAIGVFFVCGVIVAAQGQVLRAALDTAVVLSPFLSHAQMAQAMGLPRGVVGHRAAGS